MIRAALMRVPLPTIIVDRALSIVFANDSFYEMFEPGQNVIGLKCYEVCTGGDSACNRCMALRALRMGREAVGVRDITPRGGVEHHFRVTTQPLRSPAGEIEYILETFEDITETAQLSVGAERSERRYYSLLQSANDAILVADPATHTFVEANRKAVEMFGYSRAELLQMRVDELHPEVERERALRTFTRIAAGKSQTVPNLSVLCKDGTIIPVEISASHVQYGGRHVVQGIIHDMRDRMRYERERQSHIRDLEFIGRLSRELAGALDINEVAGLVLQGMVNLIQADIWAVYANVPSAQGMWFPACAASDEPTLQWVESTVREIVNEFTQDGEERRISTERKPIEIGACAYDPPSVVRSRLAVPFNVSEKFAGVLLVGSRREQCFGSDQLHILSTLAMEMELAIEKLIFYRETVQSERLTAIGQTVAGIAHSVANAVSAVSNAVHVIDVSMEQRDWVRAAKAWKIVKRDMRSISRLVTNMLDYSKEREPILERSNLVEVVQEVADEFAGQAEAQNVTVSIDMPPTPVTCWVDQDQIKDCIRNLVSNALDAMPEGGSLTVSLKRTGGSIQNGPIRDLVEIEVRDTGVGISTQAMENLFVPFYSTKGSKGTGVGLAVSQKIVQEHGGEIQVMSKPGEGATFTILIPIRSGSDLEQAERETEGN